MRRPLKNSLHSFSFEYFEFFEFWLSLLIETGSFCKCFELVWPLCRLSISLLEFELGDAWTDDCTDDWNPGSPDPTEDSVGDWIKDDCSEDWSFLDFFRFRFFSSTFNFFSLTLTASPSITWVFPDATKCRHLFVLWNKNLLTRSWTRYDAFADRNDLSYILFGVSNKCESISVSSFSGHPNLAHMTKLLKPTSKICFSCGIWLEKK